MEIQIANQIGNAKVNTTHFELLRMRKSPLVNYRRAFCSYEDLKFLDKEIILKLPIDSPIKK